MDCHSFIEDKISQRPILLIGKAYDPLTREVEKYIKDLGVTRSQNNVFECLHIDGRQDVSVIDTYIYQKWLTKCRTTPHLFISGQYVAGGMDLIWQIRRGMLQHLMNFQAN